MVQKSQGFSILYSVSPLGKRKTHHHYSEFHHRQTFSWRITGICVSNLHCNSVSFFGQTLTIHLSNADILYPNSGARLSRISSNFFRTGFNEAKVHKVRSMYNDSGLSPSTEHWPLGCTDLTELANLKELNNKHSHTGILMSALSFLITLV